ncbi:hypothetical protein FB45DRAFT_308275 [Roridomyces roridus]|uniref:F-box domain-containing protein n=1 Tax=Roridomyces roridus TaxID=1738132 RepID=A0AAD7B7G6_9AGAR|nr:hypothetical protein FB45DRAFT_308275 [Roridomyces roridus]
MVNLMRPAKKTRGIIHLLPNELLTKIIQLLPRADQLALCRVSKHFHALTIPGINRNVLISTHQSEDLLKLDGFCLGLAENAERAELVRSLQVVKSCSYSESAYDQLVDSIKLMKRLECLALDIITGDGGPIVPRLAYLSLPNLSGCRFILPSTNLRAVAVAQFLGRHENLTHVRLWDLDGSHIYPLLPQWDATCLPNLQHYQGTPAFLRVFSTRKLQAVRMVSLDQNRASLSELERLIDPARLGLVVSICHIHQAGIFESLSKCMPYITTLELRRLGFQHRTHSGNYHQHNPLRCHTFPAYITLRSASRPGVGTILIAIRTPS